MNARKLFTVVCLAMLTQGCHELPAVSDDNQVLPPQAGSGLVVRPNSPIADVPMPVGFVVVETTSRSWASAGEGRYVEHYYQGRAAIGDTVNFYRQELARNQWVLRSERAEGGTFMLSYTKGRENLTARISSPRSVTTVMILIRAQGSAQPFRPTVP